MYVYLKEQNILLKKILEEDRGKYERVILELDGKRKEIIRLIPDEGEIDEIIILTPDRQEGDEV